MLSPKRNNTNILVLVAIVIGFISILPHFFAAWSLGNNYQGIAFTYQNNEDVYLARIQEVVEGKLMANSALFHEYKDIFFPVFPGGEYLYVILVILLNITTVGAAIFAKFFFPALLFVLISTFACKLFDIKIKDSSVADILPVISIGILIVLGYDLVDYRTIFEVLREGFSTTTLSVWTRPVNPITGALFLFGYLLIIYNAYSKVSFWKIVTAGIIFGLSVGYVFSFSIILAITVLLLLYYIYKKNWETVKNLVIVSIIAIVTSMPFWYKFIGLYLSDKYLEMSLKNGLFFTHSPVLNRFLLASTIVFTIFSIIKKYSKANNQFFSRWWIFSVVLLLSCWAVFNQQLITGRTIWIYHYVQYTIPLCIVVVAVAYFRFVNSRVVKIFTASLIIIVSMFYGISSAYSYKFSLNDFSDMQNLAQIFNVLNTKDNEPCVVFVNEPRERINNYIPVYTECDVYTSGFVFGNIPRDRIMHNYLLKMLLRNVKFENIRAYLDTHRTEVVTNFFETWDQLFGEYTDEWISSIEDEITRSYVEFLSKDISLELNRYTVTHIISDGELDSKLIFRLKLVELNSKGAYRLYLVN